MAELPLNYCAGGKPVGPESEPAPVPARVMAGQRLDLQFFGQDPDKTEEATAKRKQEARKRGQVPKSSELNAVVVLFGLFILLNVMGGWVFGELYAYLRNALSPGELNQVFSDAGIARLIMRHTFFIAKVFLPLGVGAMVIGGLINYIQVGSLFTLEPLKPNFSRINPISGFKRFFSTHGLIELVKAAIKLSIVANLAYTTIAERILILNQSLLRSPLEAVRDIWNILFLVAVKICSFLLVLAIFDYAYQRWHHKKSLRMSKKEVKDEFKQMEGNPQIKSKIRQRQMQIAMRRMMQEVPTADVVITNPTHFAVALRYDPATMAAPVIVAKGEGLIAARIKEIAIESGVTIVENKPLAQALFKTVEIGEAVPEKLFQAVAEVLAFVYRLKRRTSL